jgi:hypothetical protein
VVQQEPAVQNFGVDQEHLSLAEAYYLNGRHASQREVFSAIAASGTLTDDSQKLHLTVIGDSNPVLADLQSNPALAPYKDKLLLQAYPANHWALAPFQLPPSTPFYLCIQRPARFGNRSQVLHAQTAYTGPEPLLNEALRKADPNFQPLSVPDLSKPPSPPPPPEPKPMDPTHPAVTGFAGGMLSVLFAIFVRYGIPLLISILQKVQAQNQPTTPVADQLLQKILDRLEHPATKA